MPFVSFKMAAAEVPTSDEDLEIMSTCSTEVEVSIIGQSGKEDS
jgi:hypothetical protein